MSEKKTTKQPKANELDMILPGFTANHPRVPEDGLLVTKDATGNDQPARAITADDVLLIEEAGNQVENLAAVCFMMQQAFFDGQPDPELTQKGLCHVGEALQKIRKDLDAIIDHIYRKGNE